MDCAELLRSVGYGYTITFRCIQDSEDSARDRYEVEVVKDSGSGRVGKSAHFNFDDVDTNPRLVNGVVRAMCDAMETFIKGES